MLHPQYLQPDYEELQIGILTIKSPLANQRCLESNNGARKSYDDLSPYLGPGQRAQPHVGGTSMAGFQPHLVIILDVAFRYG